jgi:hypothetical protein
MYGPICRRYSRKEKIFSDPKCNIEKVDNVERGRNCLIYGALFFRPRDKSETLELLLLHVFIHMFEHRRLSDTQSLIK